MSIFPSIDLLPASLFKRGFAGDNVGEGGQAGVAVDTSLDPTISRA